METMNIAVPVGLKEFVQTRVAEDGYSSGPPVPMTAEDWDSIRAEVRKRFEALQGRAATA